MKKLIGLSIAVFLFAIYFIMYFIPVNIIPYFYEEFTFIEDLSLNEFGDYIGGILNPTLTFFSTCLLIFSVYHQLKESRKLERENHRLILVKIVNDLAEVIDDIFKRKDSQASETFLGSLKQTHPFDVMAYYERDLQEVIEKFDFLYLQLIFISEMEFGSDYIKFYKIKYKDSIESIQHATNWFRSDILVQGENPYEFKNFDWWVK